MVVIGRQVCNANAVSKNRIAATLLAVKEPLLIPDQLASIVANNDLGSFPHGR